MRQQLSFYMSTPAYRAVLELHGWQDVADQLGHCLLYTSDAADERSSVDLGGRRIIKKKKLERYCESAYCA